MIALLGWSCATLLLVVSLLAVYQWVLAAAALIPARATPPGPAGRRSRLLVLIPAYNEETGLATTLRSLERVDYPRNLTRVVVIADRCKDATAAVARGHGVECLERSSGAPGKGAALAWAMTELRAAGADFDALVLVDADTVVDAGALGAFDRALRSGHEVQQGYNYLSNPWATPFTRIIAVTSVLRNALFYGGKERLGLSSMLSGCGMCFSRRVIDRFGWTAFSVGEDWEFSVALLLEGEAIHFNGAARVRATESQGFRQASTQRLRWASGRHGVAGSSTRRLLAAGVRRRRLDLWDAALTLVAPTYSVQATMASVGLACAALLAGDPGWSFLLPWAAAVTATLAAYFAAGIALTDAPGRALGGVLLIPLFLPWRAAIEVLGLLGYGRRHWVRTARLRRDSAVTSVLLATLCGLGCPAEARGQVIFEDDFEDATVGSDGIISGWDGPADLSTMYLTGQQAFSGRRSLELKYLPGTYGASFMYRLFTGRDRIHLRWYQRWSPGFIWEPSATKMVILRPMGGYPQFYPEVLWANGQLAIQAQVIAEANWDSRNFYQNIGVPVVFGADRWYCIEVFVKLNTPGAADGELAAWIDGELKLSYAGRRFRGDSPLDPAPSTAQIQAAGLTGYYGGVTTVPLLQRSWQDDVVASADRISCDLAAEDFEARADAGGAIPGWDGPSNPQTIYTGDREAARGQRSLEIAYQPGAYSAGYAYRHFRGQERVYVRWFQRWSQDFQWAPSTTGLIGLRPGSGYPQFYPFAAGQDGAFAIQAQVLADRQWGSENFFQNEGQPVRFEPQRWYCIEVMVQLNAPGQADGAIAAWIDDDRKLFYDGRALRGSAAGDPSPPAARLSQLLVVGQYSADTPVPLLQTSWQDDLIVSPQRIGCQTPARAVR